MSKEEQKKHLIKMMEHDEKAGIYQKKYNLTEEELKNLLFDCWLVSKNLCEGSPDYSFFVYFDKIKKNY